MCLYLSDNIKNMA